MKYYFIVNPLSGLYEETKVKLNIKKACKKRGINFEILYSKHPHDGENIARDISDDEECMVFSVGGDGSLNDVLNGIVGSKNKILASIPAGSGNDFNRTITGLDKGVHTIDIGKVNNRYFLNVVCIGYEADVANNIDIIRKRRWIPKKFRYKASLLYTFFRLKPNKAKISLGDISIENDYTSINVCNGQYYGGGFRIAPHAMLDDDMFDIYLLEKVGRLKLIKVLIKIIRQSHEKSDLIVKYKDREIIVDSEEELAFNIDGEKAKAKHIEMSVVKEAIRVLNDEELVGEILAK